ncbi:MAG: hypothetical protein GKC03_09495 [Methanomassiliicoccales archaeon]|nr:hypothetical protein [Methanomassiliicoccales archaeon]
MSRSRLILAFIVALLITSGLIVTANHGSAEDLIGQDSIVIDGDTEFAQMALSKGWPGNGSEGDPYIIQGYSIDAREEGSCIAISNTTVHFVISDSLLINAGPLGDDPGCGITLLNVTNGIMDNIRCIACEFAGIWINGSEATSVLNSSCRGSDMYGIMVSDSSNCTVSWSQCDDTFAGILLYGSDNCTLERNHCYDDQGAGIMIQYSNFTLVAENDLAGSGVNLGVFFSDDCLILNNTLERGETGINLMNSLNCRFEGNEMTQCSFNMVGNADGRRVETYASQEIVNCTVNGLPIRYFKNLDFGNETVPVDSGQIIVANVTSMTISGIEIGNTSVGVIVAHSSSVFIHDSSFSSSMIGIYTDRALDCMIYDCQFHDMVNGIDLFWSLDSVVTRNSCHRNSNVGIYLEGSSRIDISDNFCSENKYGVYLTNYAGHNHITRNTVLRSSEDGIYLWGSPHNEVENNTVELSRMNGISCWPLSNGNALRGNILHDNGGFGIYALSANNLTMCSGARTG